jgi:soluble lytic murein transglycosylase
MPSIVCQSIDTFYPIHYKVSMRKIIFTLLIVMSITVSCKGTAPVNIFPTAVPAATATPSPIPATPTTPPTPTPIPAVRIHQGEDALFLGNYENARREFQTAYTSSGDPEVQAAALLGMGRSLYLAENYSTADGMFQSLLDTFPQSPLSANAYFFLAQSLEAQNQYAKAADAFGKYLELRPNVLDAYVQERRGDAYAAAGNPAAAAGAYDQSVQAPRLDSPVWVELKLGKAYAAAGDFANALKTYLHVYETSDNDYARAQANLLMGQAYITMGEREQAHARFLDSVANFPRSYDTYSGLVQLVNDGIPVNELSRGIVDYYARQYGLAVDAFTRHIASATELNATPYHYRALSYLAVNQIDAAMADWNTVIANYPTDPLWANAWEEKAYVQWAYLDRYADAAATLLEYISIAPQSAQAPEFLFQAARIYERNNQLAEAAKHWESLIELYPSAEKSYRGLFLAGITYYRMADYASALTVFQRALVLGNNPEEQSAAYLWIGKTHQAKGDPAAARNAWEQGARLDPTGYYSERANELAAGKAPFVVTRPVDLGYDMARERPAAEEWLKRTFAIPAETDLNSLGDLAADTRMVRAQAFWELGLHHKAREEMESLRKDSVTDAARTYRLMNSMLEMGLYRSAILSSRQILDLANMDDVGTLQAPAYFNHVRFGVYFRDQILAASQSEGFHPLFLLSIMRQESLFEGFAQSGAGARGLMQIMPATGQEVASNMGWPEGFTIEDLYRPEVSIKLGARYLSRQRDYFNGSMYATLAAYNGGPGNTGFWIQLAGDDQDLLLEVIRADETRTYIMQIFEFFNIYRLLYERGL